MSKFSNMGIMSVDFKAENNKGEEVEFKFKPLPFVHYPEVYDLTQALSKTGMFSQEDKDIDMFSSLDKDVMKKLIDVEKLMVKYSYPEETDEEIEEFVIGNSFALIEPLMNLITRQEKSNPRKVEKIQNELSKKD